MVNPCLNEKNLICDHDPENLSGYWACYLFIEQQVKLLFQDPILQNFLQLQLIMHHIKLEHLSLSVTLGLD
jgi:hypothetical protein